MIVYTLERVFRNVIKRLVCLILFSMFYIIAAFFSIADVLSRIVPMQLPLSVLVLILNCFPSQSLTCVHVCPALLYALSRARFIER